MPGDPQITGEPARPTLLYRLIATASRPVGRREPIWLSSGSKATPSSASVCCGSKWEREGPRLRGHLAGLCRREGIDADALEGVRGHRLPLRRAGFVPARGRALLVGDAAGLVDPLTGDGMYEAFVSARLRLRRRATMKMIGPRRHQDKTSPKERLPLRPRLE